MHFNVLFLERFYFSVATFLERLINKLRRCEFLPMSAPSASTLANKAVQRLFRSVIHNTNHVLHKLLPEVKRVSYNLRPLAHGFEVYP